MAHLQRGDIPYQYALADAFTICDAYHASLLGPTDPNRYHMFTGWVGNNGKGGGPVVDNTEAGYTWTTFPEILQAAGITWKVYQDIGIGLNAAGAYGDTSDPLIGNYGDNSLLYFDQYRNAEPGSPLYENAVTGTNAAVKGTIFDNFRSDVLKNKLPQVSWVVAPEAYSEHPNWPANYGAYYVSEILNALTANPSVWSKTVFFIMYDENDGLFDHVVPPTPPQTAAQGLSTVSIANEIYPGDATAGYQSGPYGLGARVPMLVVSPWSKGGWVSSEVFDHTSLIRFVQKRSSLIRFVQKRFGTAAHPLTDTNITAWRSAVSGDLTSAFNFATPNSATVPLPSTASYVPPNDTRQNSYIPLPPVLQTLPVQESGTRPARPVPYVPNVNFTANPSTGKVNVEFFNTGTKAAFFQVRTGVALLPPRGYTVSPNQTLSDSWQYAVAGLQGYELSIYGPNGFFRGYKGGLIAATSANLQTSISYNLAANGVTLTVLNSGKTAVQLQIQNVYTNQNTNATLNAGAKYNQLFAVANSNGWYDIIIGVESDSTFQQQLAGHLETGKPSTTDPAIPIK